MNTLVVAGQVYDVDGAPAAATSVQQIAGGDGCGHFITYGYFCRRGETEKVQWAKEITDKEPMPHRPDLRMAITSTGAVKISPVTTTHPLSPTEPFWTAAQKHHTSQQLEDFLRGGNLGSLLRGHPRRTHSAQLVYDWATLLFNETLPPVISTPSDSEIWMALNNYSRQTKQLIMWWVRRAAMERVKIIVPMGTAQIQDGHSIFITGPQTAKAPRGTRRSVMPVAVQTGSRPGIQGTEWRYSDIADMAFRRFEEQLIPECRTAGTSANYDSPALAFGPLDDIEWTPFQEGQGNKKLLDSKLWVTGDAIVTIPNSPRPYIKATGQPAPINSELTKHVDTVFAAMIKQMPGPLKSELIAKINDIHITAGRAIQDARRALLDNMNTCPEFDDLFETPAEARNAFYGDGLREAVGNYMKFCPKRID